MEQHWYGVKCLIEHGEPSDQAGAHLYEERVVVFRATDFDQAIELAEREVTDYARQNDARYLGYCNAFKMDAAVIEKGTEVYSVMREVPLSPRDFIDRYYDDGTDKHC
jgi:hypothetical protein